MSAPGDIPRGRPPLRKRHIAAGDLGQSLLRQLLVGRVSPDSVAPFEGVKTKPDDLWSVALLQGWAEVVDILSFYQERILAEGYIDTAEQPLSRRLLQSELGLERGRRTALAAPPKPGAPMPIVLDPGCAPTADFIFGLRTAPGLPAVTVLPAGAQLRRHAVDAPNVTTFETETTVGLRAEWADLPIGAPQPVVVPGVVVGAPGLLTALKGGPPGQGDRLLFSAHDDPTDWQHRTVTVSTPNAKAGICELSLDTPIATAMSAPAVLAYTRRAPLFGWNAADFASLPAAARLAAVQGIENTLAGGVGLPLANPPVKLNAGLSTAAPRALAMGPDGTIYLATGEGLAWAPGGKAAWLKAPSSAAVRDIGVLTVAPDGLVMIGGAAGNVWVGRDPGAGFEGLIGGYVLEAAPGLFQTPKPVKATLPGGPARALFAIGDPTSRVLAQTDGGLFEYDPKGFWLSVTAADWGLRILADFEPIQARLNGKRLAACLVSRDRDFGVLAYGLEVEIVRLGEAVPPPPPVAGATPAAPTTPPMAPVTPAPPPPPSTAAAALPATTSKPGWLASLGAWIRHLFKPEEPAKPKPPPSPHRAKHKAARWIFDAPVIALAPVAGSSAHGWDSFLAADANGVYRIDWDKAPVRADDGLPLGPVTSFIVDQSGPSIVVRVALPTGVYRFDAATSTWTQEVAAQTAGPVVAAAAKGRLAVAEPLVLPAEWPGFDLASGITSIDLSAQGVELAPGETIVLSSATGTLLPATVVSATPLAIDGFGLRERILRVAFTPLGSADTASFSRRTTMVDVGGKPVTLVLPPNAGGTVIGPSAELILQGDWSELGQPPPPTPTPALPASGVAGGDRRAMPPDLAAMTTWGAQPLDVSGVAAKLAAPEAHQSTAPRIAVTGPSASVLPMPLGGVSSTAEAGGARDLAGCDVRALALTRGGLYAATATDGVFLQATPLGPWAPANDGLVAPDGFKARALAITGSGADQVVYLMTAEGLYQRSQTVSGWVRLADAPSATLTTLCVLSSGTVMAGGVDGLFAWTADAWSPALGGVMPTATPVAALAAWGDGCLAAPASGGVLFAQADNLWQAWAPSLSEARVAAIAAAGTAIYLASDAGLYSTVDGVSTRQLLDVGCAAVDVAGGVVAVGVVGQGLQLSGDGGTTWRSIAAGLANDLTAVSVISPTDVRAAAGPSLHLTGSDGPAVWTPAAALAVVPADLVDSLDAGLAGPLKAALPPAVAKALPDGGVISLIAPGSLWMLGAPGKGLGQGAMLLALQADGVAVSLPTDVFAVEAAADAADGSGPMRLSLSGVAASGSADAWPADLIAVPTAQPAVTAVRSILGVTVSVSADLSSSTLTLDQPLGVLLDAAQTHCTANVATASQGETVAGEILGDGDAGSGFQTFTLRRSPLTFLEGDDGVSRPALRVFVNGVEWTPVATLVGAGPSDRVYVLKIDPSERGEITFGDGVTGARLPNGRGNVTATYRAGMTPMQTLDPSVITVLMSRPSIGAVRGVIRTPGRAPAIGTAQARAVQASLRSLGRLVTAGDYVQFVQTFTQVGSAIADELEVRARPLIYVSVALAGGKTAAQAGFSLSQARNAIAVAQAIPAPPFEIGLAVPRPVKIAAKLWIQPSAVADQVEAAAKAALVGLLGPAHPAIGRSRRLTEIEDLLQRAPGVAGVEVEAFYFAGRSKRANARLDAARARRSASGVLTAAEMLILDGADDAVSLTVQTVGATA